MASRIDAFYKRLEKTEQIKGKSVRKDTPAANVTDAIQEGTISASVTYEDVSVSSEAAINNEVFLREERLKALLDGIAGKLLIKESTAKKKDGFIFKLFSTGSYYFL